MQSAATASTDHYRHLMHIVKQQALLDNSISGTGRRQKYGASEQRNTSSNILQPPQKSTPRQISVLEDRIKNTEGLNTYGIKPIYFLGEKRYKLSKKQ